MFVRFVPANGADFKHAKIQIDPNETITSIREKLAKHFSIENFKMLYHGKLVSDFSQTGIFYKMNANSTLHIIESATSNITSEENAPKKPAPSEDEIQQFLIAFGLAVRNPAFHKVAQRLGQKENLENIIATCPELAKDPVACAFLTRPELLYSLLDQDTLKYVHERHPGLCEAAYQLAAAVHEEKPTAKTGAGSEEVPAPFLYNLDEMSDDDDEGEDMETGEINRQPRGGARGSLGGGNPITADQLASAIASAQSVLGMAPPPPSPGMGGMTGFTSNRPPTSAASGSAGTASTSGSMGNFSMPSVSNSSSAPRAAGPNPFASGFGITQNDLAQALALAGVGNAFQPPPSTMNPGNTGSNPPAGPNYTSQLATMREVGIMDERLATRALEVMGGDVQAAIDLIYSGWDDSQ